MAMSLLLFLAIAPLGAGEVVVNPDGTVYVDPAERGREERGTEMLRDANAYFNRRDLDAGIGIGKYERVLQEVELLPTLRMDVLFKLAQLYGVRGGQRIHTDESDGANVALGKSDLERASAYYTEVLSTGIGQQRPALLADSLLGLGHTYTSLDKYDEAVKYYAQARKLAVDESPSSDEDWTAQRRHSTATIALTGIMNALRVGMSVRAREEMASQTGNDTELARVLGEPTNGKASGGTATERQKNLSSGSWGLYALLALVLAAIVFGSTAAMRKGL